MNHKTHLLPPLFLLLIFSLISPVFASGEPVDIQQLPHQVGEALGIGDFAGGILCFIIMTFALMLPAMIWSKKGSIASLVIGIGVLGFGVAVLWIPYWFLLILVLIVAVMFGEDVRKVITGGF